MDGGIIIRSAAIAAIASIPVPPSLTDGYFMIECHRPFASVWLLRRGLWTICLAILLLFTLGSSELSELTCGKHPTETSQLCETDGMESLPLLGTLEICPSPSAGHPVEIPTPGKVLTAYLELEHPPPEAQTLS